MEVSSNKRRQTFINQFMNSTILLILKLIIYYDLSDFLKDAPVQPKKTKLQETQKLKKIISKAVNSTIEDELRDRALEGKKTLVKKNTSNSQKT